MIQENQEGGEEPVLAEESESVEDTVSIPKADYEKMNQTIGSLKREVKDFKKSKEPEVTSQTNQKKSDDFDFGGLAYHNTKPEVVKVVHDDDVEYLKSTMKESGKSMSEVLGSKFFQAELKDRLEARTVVNATPSSTRRSGEPGNQLEIEYTKYLQTGKLPNDPAIRQAVVQKRYDHEKSASQFTSQSVIEN